MRKIKSLKEEFSPLRSSSPYKVRRDKGFVQDATPQMTQRYLLRKAEEENTYYQKQLMFGELDKLEPLFMDLFKQIGYIRDFIESQKKQPLIEREQRDSLNKLVKLLDAINTRISTKVLKELDNLGIGKNSQEDEYFG